MEFKRIVEHPEYGINREGIVINLKTGEARKPYINEHGYIMVSFYNYGKNNNCGVHNLLAKAYVRGITNHKIVTHIDGNKQNNKIENLKWCKNPYAKLNEDDVRKIRDLSKTGNSQKSLASMFKVSRTCISDVQRKKTWKYVK